MASYFVQAAKPKISRSKRYKTWDSLAQIQAQTKTKNRLPVGNYLSVKNKRLKLIENYTESEIAGRFMVTSWEETVSEPVTNINWYSASGEDYTTEDIINIDCFKTKDSTEKGISPHLMNMNNGSVSLERSRGIER